MIQLRMLIKAQAKAPYGSVIFSFNEQKVNNYQDFTILASNASFDQLSGKTHSLSNHTMVSEAGFRESFLFFLKEIDFSVLQKQGSTKHTTYYSEATHTLYNAYFYSLEDHLVMTTFTAVPKQEKNQEKEEREENFCESILESQDDLVSQANKLTTIIEAMPDMIIIMRRDGTVLEILGAIEENLTGQVNDLIGCNIKNVFTTEEFNRHLSIYEECFESGEMRSIRFSLEINGTDKEFESRLKPLDNSRLLTIVRDISLETQLLKEQEYRSFLFENDSNALVLFNANHKVIDVNSKFCELIGYSSNELKGMRTWEIDAQYSEEYIRENFIDRADVNLVFESVHRRKDGSIYDVEISVISFDKYGERMFFCYCKDITEKNKVVSKLKQTQIQLKTIGDNLPNGAVYQIQSDRANTKRDCTYISEGIEKICGISASQIIDDISKFYNLILKEDVPRIAEKEAESHKELSVFNEEIRIRDAKGKLKWLKVASAPRLIGKDEILWDGIMIDITDKKFAEEEAKNFKTIIDKAVYGLAISDLKGNVLYINDFFAAIHGYQPHDLIGEHLSIFHSETQMPNVHKHLQKLFEEGSFEASEIWHVHKNGTEFPMLMSGVVIHDNEGNPQFIVASAIDLTDYNKAKEKLQESDNRFAQIAAHNQTIIWEVDIKGLYTYVSPKSEHIWGYKPEELVGKKHYYDLHPDINREEYRAMTLEMLNKGIAFKDFENRIERKDGTMIWVTTNGVPVFNKNNELIGYRGSDNDITQRKAAEFETKRFKVIAESGNYGMAITNDVGIIEYVNPFIAEIHGYKVDEVIGKPLSIFHTEQQLIDTLYLFESLKENGAHDPAIVWHCHKNGTEFPMLMSGTVINDVENNVQYIATSALDMTDYFKAEKQIKEQETRYSSIIELSNTGAWEYDIERNSVWCSKGYFSMLGYDVSEFDLDTTNNIDQVWVKLINASDRIKAQESFSAYLKNEKPGLYENTFRMKHKDGHDIWIWSRGQRLKNEDGSFSNRVLGTHIDISDQKKYLEKIEKLLKVEEKQNQSLQSFTHIVSHNLRVHTANMLGVLMLLESENPKLYDDEYINMIKKSADKLEETITDLNETLSFRHTTLDQYKTIRLYDFIDDEIEQIRADEIYKDIEFIIRVDRKERIHTIPAFLKRILSNLIENAAQFRSPSREAFIKIVSEKKGDFIALSIEDNGVGIDLSRHGEKLFDMYKRFHEDSTKKGLGLYIVKNQVEALGGYIEVQSELNKGSKFTIFLPNEKI